MSSLADAILIHIPMGIKILLILYLGFWKGIITYLFSKIMAIITP